MPRRSLRWPLLFVLAFGLSGTASYVGYLYFFDSCTYRTCCGFVRPAYQGRTVESIFDELQKPAEDVEFSLGDGCSRIEFRIELHNFYPKSDPSSANIRIRECVWHYAAHHLAVWFHLVNGKWVVLDTCEWPNDIEF
jgi:hypothetical protein